MSSDSKIKCAIRKRKLLFYILKNELMTEILLELRLQSSRKFFQGKTLKKMLALPPFC